jgi:hypothetical protein
MIMIFCTRKKFQDSFRKANITLRKELKISLEKSDYKRLNKHINDWNHDLFWNPWISFGLIFPFYYIKKRYYQNMYDFKGSSKKDQIYNSAVYYFRKQLMYCMSYLDNSTKHIDLEKLKGELENV